ncbi:MAG: hypothetical protein HC893_08130 [Chloroflexaceae bacterium]|nr:hypothetical protein [Chloroflexaceae bacterium]NJL33821.1 hypothetical protein [Chloroflexaceae bacterium]NJO07790.1 hypothetical protein [Chloroflexaceae bacterium]
MTTSTVTTVTTATATAGVLGVSLSFIAIVALCIFMVQKEIISNVKSSWSPTMSKALDMAIVPLFLSFLMIAAFKIFEVLK